MDRRVYDNYVIQVAKHGSLTRAAAALGITQPALSSGLNSLEKELGFVIFNRRSNPVSFTDEGEIYFDYINRLQTLGEDMRKRIEALRQNLESELTIGAPVAYSDSLVADTVVELINAQPNYKISIKSAPLAELTAMAAAGELNCFISTSEELPANFQTELIKRERLFLCVPAENAKNAALQERSRAKAGGAQTAAANKRADDAIAPIEAANSAQGSGGAPIEAANSAQSSGGSQTAAASKSAQKSRDEIYDSAPDFALLSGERFVLLEKDQPIYAQTEAFLKENGIVPGSYITVNQVSTAVNLSARGAGICVASEDALASCRGAELGQICAYPLPDRFAGRGIYIAYDKELKMPEACRRFIETLIK